MYYAIDFATKLGQDVARSRGLDFARAACAIGGRLASNAAATASEVRTGPEPVGQAQAAILRRELRASATSRGAAACEISHTACAATLVRRFCSLPSRRRFRHRDPEPPPRMPVFRGRLPRIARTFGPRHPHRRRPLLRRRRLPHRSLAPRAAGGDHARPRGPRAPRPCFLPGRAGRGKGAAGPARS